jgi:3-oxoacyl-(acyl-carrier-protein) synthase
MTGQRGTLADRIVVTGLGACTPLDRTLDLSWQRLARGESAIVPLVHLEGVPNPPRAVALSAGASEPPRLRVAKHAKYAGRAVSCMLHALAEATGTAGWPAVHVDPERIAIYGATGQTGLDVEEFFPALSAAWADDPRRDYAKVGGVAARLVDPHFSLRTLANGGLALVAAQIGAHGPSANYVQSELASAFALRAAWRDLTDHRADLAVVFACDSLAHPSTWLAYERAGLLSRQAPPDAHRPFDARRDGVVLGEGGAVMVLERATGAAARGACPVVEFAGIRVSAAGASVASPSALALQHLLQDPHALDTGGARHEEPARMLLIARGLGTVEHDRAEATAIVTAGHANVPTTAFKGATGYLGAATGLVEAALAARALSDEVVPPVVHLVDKDPACPIDVAGAARGFAGRSRMAVTCLAGWDGQWAVIALRTLGASQDEQSG